MTRSAAPGSALIGASDVDLAQAAQAALADRLTTAAVHLLPGAAPAAGDDPAGTVADLLEAAVRALAPRPDNDRIWLLLTAVAAAFPSRGQVDRTRRKLQLRSERAAVLSVLADTLELAAEAGDLTAPIDVVDRAVVVDVDHTAKYDLHTGIQRVSRSLMPIWTADHGVVPAAWTAQSGALRHLFPAELARVVEWSGIAAGPEAEFGRPLGELVATRLLVPWRSVLVLVEVPPAAACDRLAAFGSYSGNRLVAVAHDAIPVVSADMVPTEDTSKFVRFLTAIKFASRVAGVSASAASEIAGFAAALPTQGLVGPTVVEVPLGAPDVIPDVPAVDAAVPGRAPAPTVLVVGSHEPRKNHLAVLHAAELLWREGEEFELVFIGGSGWGDEFPRRAAELRQAGRSITVRRAVTDDELNAAYAAARFTVFPSLHEGFGLPVVESIAHGTPVITSDFGSTAESGAAGGTILIDPRDDEALTSAMRTLLTDDEVLRQLREQIAARPERTWKDYADDLWEQLVEPERQVTQ
ncbi:glycosyltransferase family 4 protein [Nakamurella sp.]|uniref:glycosyltransferase family 4 protein n=1 Tax=Nakamurella sp. TaxID=1869182 RepID=UPI003B3A6283